MSENEIFTISLISAVKKRPILYDSQETGGNKKGLEKNAAWSDIANEVGENVKTIKNRWKGLKECYVKYKKSRSQTYCNPTYDQYRNWRWASYLEFMEPHLRGLRNMDESIYVPEYDYQDVKNDSDINIFEDCDSNNDASEVLSTKSINKIQVNDDTKDDIHYLFLSYAETLRKFPPKKQITVKLELAKLFSKAEMDNLENIDPFSN